MVGTNEAAGGSHRRTSRVAAFTVIVLAACSGADAVRGQGDDAGLTLFDGGAAATTDATSGASPSADGGEPGSTDAGAQHPTDASSDAGGACGAGDPNLPPEPTIPPACATVNATQSVAAGALASEAPPDTATIQAALDGCAAGQAVRLAPTSANNALLTGPLTLPPGVTLWVDKGVTLYGTRDPALYGSATALILAKGARSRR